MQIHRLNAIGSWLPTEIVEHENGDAWVEVQQRPDISSGGVQLHIVCAEEPRLKVFSENR